MCRERRKQEASIRSRWQRQWGFLWAVTLMAITIWVNCNFFFRNGSAIGLPVPPITALITPGPVRHCQIPDLPVDGSLFFEFLFFIYLLIVLFIQYINIYKTVWWYPYNHPASCTSLNFHLIDYHLAAFITVMLARRLVWALISEVYWLIHYLLPLCLDVVTRMGLDSIVKWTNTVLIQL